MNSLVFPLSLLHKRNMLNDDDRSTVETLNLIAQVFGKIAINFWPVIVLGIVAVVILHKHETRRTR